MDVYKEALYDILDSNSLFVAKEIAAEVLEEDVQEYIDTPDLGYDDNDNDNGVAIEDILKDFR